jgi:hypothetical protein
LKGELRVMQKRAEEAEKALLAAPGKTGGKTSASDQKASVFFLLPLILLILTIPCLFYSLARVAEAELLSQQLKLKADASEAQSTTCVSSYFPRHLVSLLVYADLHSRTLRLTDRLKQQQTLLQQQEKKTKEAEAKTSKFVDFSHLFFFAPVLALTPLFVYYRLNDRLAKFEKEAQQQQRQINELQAQSTKSVTTFPFLQSFPLYPRNMLTPLSLQGHHSLPSTHQ